MPDGDLTMLALCSVVDGTTAELVKRLFDRP
jgi:hypothetical protein